MNVWTSYQARLSSRGDGLRDTRLRRADRFISDKLLGSLSYHIAEVDGVERELAIINSDNYDQKTICTLPGEDILGGELVFWEDNYWIVIRRDANNELYAKAVMQQCNYLLRWVADDGKIIERWSIIADGTKYLTGETISSYNDNGMSLGDTRISMVLSRDPYTSRLNRSNRFLIDDYDSGVVLAYRLTKPFKLGSVYNGHGAMAFVLTEVNTEDDDNFELHIADYYTHFPRDADKGTAPVIGGERVDGNGRKVWF